MKRVVLVVVRGKGEQCRLELRDWEQGPPSSSCEHFCGAQGDPNSLREVAKQGGELLLGGEGEELHGAGHHP